MSGQDIDGPCPFNDSGLCTCDEDIGSMRKLRGLTERENEILRACDRRLGILRELKIDVTIQMFVEDALVKPIKTSIERREPFDEALVALNRFLDDIRIATI